MIVFLLGCAILQVLIKHPFFSFVLFLTLASSNSLVLGYTEVKVYNANNDKHLLIIFTLEKNIVSRSVSSGNELGSFTKYLDDTYLWLFHGHLIHGWILFHKFYGTASIETFLFYPKAHINYSSCHYKNSQKIYS